MNADDRQSHQPGERATAWIAMLVDAWSELRVNRLRILLALVGIMVAVIGLTGALGAGSILKDTLIETGERQSGRTATVSVSLSPSNSVTPQQQLELLRSLPTDYGVSDWSIVSSQIGTVLTPQNRHSVSVTGVDPAYQQIYRVPVVQGQFLTAQDADRLAPAIVVNDKLWERLGSPNLATNPGVTFLVDHHEQTAVIVGVTANTSEWDEPLAYVLNEQLSLLTASDSIDSTRLSMWVPEAIADELAMQLSTQLEPLGMFTSRDDWAKDNAAAIVGLQWAVIAAAAGMFGLGALGLVNINLVTMQHRVREIGIRRSYGATTGRIFLGVLLESVVATFVAGFAGVLIAVLLVQNPLVESLLRSIGVYEPSPFPLQAALIGLGAATLVGAIAGALPALTATRVQIVDAIRY
ncbi:ABC transporter permease [Gulosibacter chungangensis]|nr:ABC transporter permease [Gulosibacter chungangensis]